MMIDSQPYGWRWHFWFKLQSGASVWVNEDWYGFKVAYGEGGLCEPTEEELKEIRESIEPWPLLTLKPRELDPHGVPDIDEH